MTADSPITVLSRRERRMLGETAKLEYPETPSNPSEAPTEAQPELTEIENASGPEPEEASAGDESPSTDSLPTVLPIAMPDETWNEDFVEVSEKEDHAGNTVSFDSFESILTPTLTELRSDLDPAVAVALTGRTVDEIMAQEGLNHADALLKVEEEEALRANYFRTESPERAEQVRLEREAQAELEHAEKTAKRKAIADRATHALKAKQSAISAIVMAVLAVASGIASYILGGA